MGPGRKYSGPSGSGCDHSGHRESRRYRSPDLDSCWTGDMGRKPRPVLQLLPRGREMGDPPCRRLSSSVGKRPADRAQSVDCDMREGRTTFHITESVLGHAQDSNPQRMVLLNGYRLPVSSSVTAEWTSDGISDATGTPPATKCRRSNSLGFYEKYSHRSQNCRCDLAIQCHLFGPWRVSAFIEHHGNLRGRVVHSRFLPTTFLAGEGRLSGQGCGQKQPFHRGQGRCCRCPWIHGLQL